MSTTSKTWSDSVEVDYVAKTVDIAKHDGSAKGLKLGGTLVTSTAAELNKNAGVTAGTVTASKAVVVDASKAVDTLTVTNLKFGATPFVKVDPASCTISGAAGAANVCTVSIQLKDGSGTNMARQVPFTVYASSAADGLTLASAASTGFAVSAGGLSLNNGGAITTSIRAISSAAGACTLTLTDTGKQTSYLVLVVDEGIKISAQLSAGSYG